MPSPRTRKPRASRSKADVADAFDDLKNTHESKEVLDSNAASLSLEQAAKTRAAVAAISVDALVQKGATLGLEMSRTLNSLTEQCVARANELQTIQDAIRIEAEELERLYGLDVASAAIAGLIEDHAAKKQELEAERDVLHTSWHEEQIAHDKATRQRDGELQAARRREEEQYEYNKRQERGRAEDEFTRKVALQERDFSDKLAASNKELAERRAKIDAEEQEITALRARVAGIEGEIRAAVAKENKILENVLNKDHKHVTELLTKDFEAKLSLEQNKNANYEKNNTALATRILELEAEVKSAHGKIAETAQKALDSASGQSALTALKESMSSTNGSVSRGGKA